MIKPEDFYRTLGREAVDFFVGVPDSLLKDFLAYVAEHAPPERNIITANEGGAVALAAGYYLSTRKLALVYMQNSGLGNAVNPLLSLADPAVYGIPMLLLIGWRGEPGIKDEPQHIKQGRTMPAMLEAMEIPYDVLSIKLDDANKTVKNAIRLAIENNTPYAILVRKGTFEMYEKKPVEQVYQMDREEAIKCILSSMRERDIVVSSTGMISREVYEIRELAGLKHHQDFLTIGAMGHASQIALGIALSRPLRAVYCLDGDGAAIMHLGSMVTIGNLAPPNLRHIILNNGAHDSVGGQPTAGINTDFIGIATSCGYKFAKCVKTSTELKSALEEINLSIGPSLLEVKVRKGSRAGLGRPTTSPNENKKAFMEFIEW